MPDYSRETALAEAVEFCKAQGTLDPEVVVKTADTFRKFLVGAWPAATPEEIDGLAVEAAKPEERTFHGEPQRAEGGA